MRGHLLLWICDVLAIFYKNSEIKVACLLQRSVLWYLSNFSLYLQVPLSSYFSYLVFIHFFQAFFFSRITAFIMTILSALINLPLLPIRFWGYVSILYG